MSNRTFDSLRHNLVRFVYGGVELEGIAASYAQTESLVDRAEDSGLTEQAALEILGLKRAVEYLLAHEGEAITLGLYKMVNYHVGLGTVRCPGELRGPGDVLVWGQSPEPFEPVDIVDEPLFVQILETAMSWNVPIEDRAGMLFANLSQAQFFHNGNKRSALLLVNYYLAANDAGIHFLIDGSVRDRFYERLFDYYTGAYSLDDLLWDLSEFGCYKSIEALDEMRSPMSPPALGRELGQLKQSVSEERLCQFRDFSSKRGISDDPPQGGEDLLVR